MKQTYKDLVLCCLTPDQRSQTCGYWYTVTDKHTPHTAFRGASGLERWLSERGIVLSAPLPELGQHSVIKLVGEYTSNCLNGADDLKLIQHLDAEAVKTKVLSNGQYTLGLLTRDEAGCVTVNYLNPNVRDRIIYEYRSANGELDEPDDIASSRLVHVDRG